MFQSLFFLKITFFNMTFFLLPSHLHFTSRSEDERSGAPAASRRGGLVCVVSFAFLISIQTNFFTALIEVRCMRGGCLFFSSSILSYL